jgi:2-C-methyl-D-erythritol 4-phosphate cytidylyltransferase
MHAEGCWVVIPAAGIGQRFGADYPKQYTKLKGRTLLDHCLCTFLGWSAAHKIVLALSASDTQFDQSEFANHPQVITVQGGAERVNSVLNALEHIRSLGGDRDWVMVHDAARPLLQVKNIEALWLARREYPAAILARPISDTIKRVAKAGVIEQTVSREGLWGAQTPQLAKVEDLSSAIRAGLANGYSITDEASALEVQGLEVGLVEGPAYNIKVTLPDDLHLANLWLERQ